MNDAPPHTHLADQAAYAEAVQLAVDAAAAYYGAGDSPIDDDSFDRLVRCIEAYEAEHPDLVLPASPIGKVAGGAVVGDVPHTVPMLSPDNVFSADQLADWAAGLERRIGRPITTWSVEPKLDGLAVSARYRGGRLVQLVTRGDGTAGEDVSHAIGTIVGLPGRLAEPVTVELRGEVMFPVKFICSGPHNSCRAGVAGPRRAMTARSEWVTASSPSPGRPNRPTTSSTRLCSNG
ncbi:hypothetical protein [Nonomuraea sp. NPDC046570]|uniref:hypothetical protein n=1 Tax=Nonomuraea sp. NPDC046570 TaxID=3155255 RepID=UPI003401CC63